MVRVVVLAFLITLAIVRYGVLSRSQVGFKPSYQSFPAADKGRKVLVNQIMRWLPGDEGGLAAGILLGGSNLVSKSTKQAFTKVGMTHILAASGYNVTIVGVWVMAFWRWVVGKKYAIWFGIVSIVVYMFLAGMGAAVVRAGIMAIAALIGLYFGREGDAGWLLVLSAVGMVAIRPEWVTDIGFQLSVAAMGGLVWLEPHLVGAQRGTLSTSPATAVDPPLLNSGEGWGEVFNFKGAFKTTIAAQIATTPLILHYFGNVSVVSPVVNAALLWIVPLVMEIVAVGLIVGPVNWLAWPLLRFMTWSVETVARWPISSWEVGKIGWEWVLVYYAVVGLWIFRKRFSRV